MLGMQATNQKMAGFGRFYSLLFFSILFRSTFAIHDFLGGVEVHKTSRRVENLQEELGRLLSI